jgi:hypothetical protein
LCQQHHAEGIGWFDQRTFRMDPRQWQQLQHALGTKGRLLDAAAEEMPATLAFPGPRTAEPSRTAAGEVY